MEAIQKRSSLMLAEAAKETQPERASAAL